ncbi:unnamed protein product [Debaryomyces tyrocola]|nr:unnamed protein product [Debaryomyces tyrocola]
MVWYIAVLVAHCGIIRGRSSMASITTYLIMLQ